MTSVPEPPRCAANGSSLVLDLGLDMELEVVTVFEFGYGYAGVSYSEPFVGGPGEYPVFMRGNPEMFSTEGEGYGSSSSRVVLVVDGEVVEEGKGKGVEDEPDACGVVVDAIVLFDDCLS